MLKIFLKHTKELLLLLVKLHCQVTKIFLATVLTSYTKMILLCVFFFLFSSQHFAGFTRTEKKYVKFINDDIYNMIIAFKTKNEIITTKKNYSNVYEKNVES